MLCPNSDNNPVGESGNEATNMNISELPLTIDFTPAHPASQHSPDLVSLASKTNAVV